MGYKGQGALGAREPGSGFLEREGSGLLQGKGSGHLHFQGPEFLGEEAGFISLSPESQEPGFRAEFPSW